jgi:hypothetical protein
MSNLNRVNPVHLAAIAAIAAVALTALTGCDPKPENVAIPTASPPASPEPSVVPDETQPPGPDGLPANPAAGQPTGQSTGQPPPQSPSWPSPEDCVSYNPGSVTVKYEAGSYTVSDGSKVVVRVYGQQGETTGQQALALAQRFSRHCYIGRNNNRSEDRNAYVFDYWRHPSGNTPSIVDQEEICSDYDRNNLTVEDMGNGYGWRVKDHDHVLHLFDNQTDARNGKLVLAKYHQICSIGDNDDGHDVATFGL